DLEARRHATPDDGKGGEREGDIRRGRDCPAREHVALPATEGDIEGGGHGHTAEGRQRRQGRALYARKLALEDLALDLGADDQEEQGHEPVVDPEQQGLVEMERTN